MSLTVYNPHLEQDIEDIEREERLRGSDISKNDAALRQFAREAEALHRLGVFRGAADYQQPEYHTGKELAYLANSKQWTERHGFTEDQIKGFANLAEHKIQEERFHEQEKLHKHELSERNAHFRQLAKEGYYTHGHTPLDPKEKLQYDYWLRHQPYEVQEAIRLGEVDGESWFKYGHGEYGNEHTTHLGQKTFSVNDVPDVFLTQSSHRFSNESMYANENSFSGRWVNDKFLTKEQVKAEHDHNRSWLGKTWSAISGVVGRELAGAASAAEQLLGGAAGVISEVIEFATGGHPLDRAHAQAEVISAKKLLENFNIKHSKEEHSADARRDQLVHNMKVAEEKLNTYKIPWAAKIGYDLQHAFIREGINIASMVETVNQQSSGAAGGVFYGELKNTSPIGQQIIHMREELAQEEAYMEKQTQQPTDKVSEYIYRAVDGTVSMLPNILTAEVLEGITGETRFGAGALYFAHSHAMQVKDELWAKRNEYLDHGIPSNASPDERAFAERLMKHPGTIAADAAIQEALAYGVFHYGGDLLSVAKNFLGGAAPKILGTKVGSEYITKHFTSELIENGVIKDVSKVVEAIRTGGKGLTTTVANSLNLTAITTIPMIIKEGMDDLIVNKPQEWAKVGREILENVESNMLYIGPTMGVAGGAVRAIQGRHMFGEIKNASNEALWRTANNGLSNEQQEMLKKAPGRFLNIFDLRDEAQQISSELITSHYDLVMKAASFASDPTRSWEELKTEVAKVKASKLDPDVKEKFERLFLVEKSLSLRADANGNVKYSKEHDRALSIKKELHENLGSFTNFHLSPEEVINSDKTGKLQEYYEKLQPQLEDMSETDKNLFASHVLQEYKKVLETAEKVQSHKEDIKKEFDEKDLDPAKKRAVERAVRASENSQTKEGIGRFLNWEFDNHKGNETDSQFFEYALINDILNRYEKSDVSPNLTKFENGDIEDMKKAFTESVGKIKEARQDIDLHTFTINQDTSLGKTVAEESRSDNSPSGELHTALVDYYNGFEEEAFQRFNDTEGPMEAAPPDYVTDRWINQTVNDLIAEYHSPNADANKAFIITHSLSAIKEICKKGVLEGEHTKDGITVKFNIEEDGIHALILHDGDEILNTSSKNRKGIMGIVGETLLDLHDKMLEEVPEVLEPTEPETVTPPSVVETQHVSQEGVDMWRQPKGAVVFTTSDLPIKLRNITVELHGELDTDVGIGPPEKTSPVDAAALKSFNDVMSVVNLDERRTMLDILKESPEWQYICDTFSMTVNINGHREVISPTLSELSVGARISKEQFIESYIMSDGHPDISVTRVKPTGKPVYNNDAPRQNFNSVKNVEILEKTGGYRLVNSPGSNNVSLEYGADAFDGQPIRVGLHRENLTTTNVPYLAKLIIDNVKAGGELVVTKELAKLYGIKMSAAEMRAAEIISMFIQPRLATDAEIQSWSKIGGNEASRAYVYFDGNHLEFFDETLGRSVIDLKTIDTKHNLEELQAVLNERGIQINTADQSKKIGDFEFGKFKVAANQMLSDGYGELLKTYTPLDQPFKNAELVLKINDHTTSAGINSSVIENKSPKITLKNLPDLVEEVVVQPKVSRASTQVAERISREVKETKKRQGIEKNGVIFSGISDSHIYDGWVKNLGIRLMADLLKGEETNGFSLKEAIKKILKSGDGLEGQSAEFVKRGVDIRSSLLHGLDQFTLDVSQYMRSLDGTRLDLEKVGDSNVSGESLRYLTSSDQIDPYAKTNARLLGVLASLDAKFDPHLTTFKTADLNTVKMKLMSILGGKIHSVTDVLSVLSESTDNIARKLHSTLLGDYDLQVAMFNTFKVNEVNFKIANIDADGRLTFRDGQSGHHRYTRNSWNKEITGLGADIDAVNTAKEDLRSLRDVPQDTFGDLAQQYSKAGDLIGVDVNPTLLEKVGREHYENIGQYDELTRSLYDQGGETRENALKGSLEAAINEPELANKLGFRGNGIDRPSKGIMQEVEHSLAHAGSQSNTSQVQRGERVFDVDNDFFHNYHSPGISRLAAFHSKYSGEAPLYVTDAKGKHIYRYQQPMFISDVISEYLHDPAYVAKIAADPMYNRYHYVRALSEGLKGGDHNFITPSELLTFQTPLGRKSVNDMTSADNATLRFKMGLSDENMAVLRQASDKTRITMVGDLPEIPETFFRNPANYIHRVWAAGEAQSLLSAFKARDNFLSHIKMDVESFNELTPAQQKEILTDVSLRDKFGFIEGYHYKTENVLVGNEYQPKIKIEGPAYEPRMFPFLADEIDSSMSFDEVRLRFNKLSEGGDNRMQNLISVDLKNIVRNYIDFLADQKLITVDHSLLQEGTYGFEMVTDASKILNKTDGLIHAQLSEFSGSMDNPEISGAMYRSVLSQLFNSVELDALLHGDRAIYGSRVNQIKRLGGEFSTFTKFAVDFPPGHEFADKTNFKVFNAHDLTVSTTDTYDQMLKQRVGSLEEPSRLLKYNLDAAKNAEKVTDWGHQFYGKSEAEVYKMTLDFEGKALDIMKKAMPTDGQSLITPQMAREMSIRLSNWSADQELAYQAMMRGEDVSVWGGANMFNTFKCMYFGPDMVSEGEMPKTGYAYHKTAYAVLDMFGDADQKTLAEWMHNSGIDVISYGSATKVFGTDKAKIFDHDNINTDEVGTNTEKFTSVRDWKYFGHQVPNEPHASQLRKVGVQITKSLLETASADTKTALHKNLKDIQEYNSNHIGSTSTAVSKGATSEETSNLIELSRKWDEVSLISPVEASRAFFKTMSDTLETKTQGSAAVIISSAGVFKEPLKFRDEHGLSETVVNSNQVSFIPKGLSHAEKLQMFEAAKEQLSGKIECVTYRIPTQGTASAEVLNIKNIVHDAYGDRIYVPHELSSKDGHDNDNDKAFIASKTYKWTPKDLENFKIDEGALQTFHKEVEVTRHTLQATNGFDYLTSAHQWAAEHKMIFNEQEHAFYSLKGKNTFKNWLNNVKIAEHTGENSLAGLGNKLVDGAINVLRSSHGAIDNTTTIDGDIQRVKNVIYKHAYVGEQEGLASVSPTSIIKEREISTSGSNTIASFAHASSMKVIYDKYVPEGHYFKGDGNSVNSGSRELKFYDGNRVLTFNTPVEALNITGKDGVRNATNGFINSDLAALVSLAVDASKDPTTYYGNINPQTSDMVAALTLEGHGDNAMLFTMQPALREYAYEQERLTSLNDFKQDSFKNTITTLVKHYDPSVTSDAMVHALLVSKVQDRIDELGSDLMSTKFLSNQLMKFKEYQEQGISMANWDKKYLLDQIAISTYAASVHEGAKQVSKYLVFNDLDSGKIKSFGTFYKTLSKLFSTGVFGERPDRNLTLSEYRFTDTPADAPYWEAKGLSFLRDAATNASQIPYVLGDNVLSAVNNIVRDNLISSSPEMIDELHNVVTKQMYSSAFQALGKDVKELVTGDKSVLNQYNKLVQAGHIDEYSALHKFLKTKNTHITTEGKLKPGGIITFDPVEIQRTGQVGDFMQAFKDTLQEIHSASGKKAFKEWVQDMITLSYISDGGTASHMFPAEFVKDHELLQKAAHLYDDGHPGDTELIQQSVLRSLANNKKFNFNNGTIDKSGSTFTIANRAVEALDIQDGKLQEFSWQLRADEESKLYLVLKDGRENAVFTLTGTEEGIAKYSRLSPTGFEFDNSFVFAPGEVDAKNEKTNENPSPTEVISSEVDNNADYLEEEPVDNNVDPGLTNLESNAFDKTVIVNEENAGVGGDYFNDKTNLKEAVKTLFESNVILPETFEIANKDYPEIRDEFEKYGVHLTFIDGIAFVGHETSYKQNLDVKVNVELRAEIAKSLGVDADQVVKILKEQKDQPETLKIVNDLLGREENDPYFTYLTADEKNTLIEQAYNC